MYLLKTAPWQRRALPGQPHPEPHVGYDLAAVAPGTAVPTIGEPAAGYDR